MNKIDLGANLLRVLVDRNQRCQKVTINCTQTKFKSQLPRHLHTLHGTSCTAYRLQFPHKQARIHAGVLTEALHMACMPSSCRKVFASINRHVTVQLACCET